MPRKQVSFCELPMRNAFIVLLAICCVWSLGLSGAFAQGNPFSAAARGMDTLSGTATPSNPFGPTARPAGPAGGAFDPMDPMGPMDPAFFQVPPDGPLTQEEFDALSPEEQSIYIEQYGTGEEGVQDIYEIPTLVINLTPAYKGRRVEDAFVHRRTPNEPLVLDDIQRIDITDDQIPQFSDDGRTLGDWVADDGIYSNIQPPSTNEYMGSDSFYSLSRTIGVLTSAQNMSVLDFFGLTAVTTERFSSIPKVRTQIEQRDQKVYRVNDAGVASGWVDSFLADYRVDTDDVSSSFFPLYVPRPPEPPAIPPPPAPWRPAGYQPTPLELAIDAYMSSLVDDPENPIDHEVIREELMIQLENATFKAQFLEEYAPREEPAEGMGGDDMDDLERMERLERSERRPGGIRGNESEAGRSSYFRPAN